MNFELTEEQKLLKRNARDFMDREIRPLADEYEKIYRPLPKDVHVELFKKIAPLGLVGGLVPVEDGGAGLDYMSYGMLMEELSRAFASLAISEVPQHAPGALALSIEGSDELKEKYLEPFMAGEKICAFGLTEPDVGTASRDVKTMAVLQGDEWVINGTKVWITNGENADLLMLIAQADDGQGNKGVSRFFVEREHSPFGARELHKLGFRSCPTSELSFEDCRVPKGNIIGEVGQGYSGAVNRIFPVLRVGLSMLAVGLCQAALETAVSYAQERKQFGRPIGKFQLVQELIADMAVETEAARLLSLQACDCIQRGENPVKACCMAKGFAPEVALRVTSKAIEVHGAVGISEEYAIERYFRDARTLIIPDGTTEVQKLVIGREVLGMAAFV